MREKSASVGHLRRDVLRFAAGPTAGLALPGGLSAASAVSVAPGGACGPFSSAGVLTFGPDNRLFAGAITDA